MSSAWLLHRESSSKSLKAIVEISVSRPQTQPSPLHELEISNGHLIVRLKKSCVQKQISADEGFESDLDTISVVSVEEEEYGEKREESDSANGSASSDGEEETVKSSRREEKFNLVNCVCYTDAKYTDVLVVVVLEETLVFRFEKKEELKRFHANFSTVKAIAHQKTYAKNDVKNFNLLQRLDSNGVMHIEISRNRDLDFRVDPLVTDYEPSSIISLNTPEGLVKKARSTENLLEEGSSYKQELKKTWNSNENLLSPPKRPDRKKRQKGPAPPPPTNILKGQFVRINVSKPITPHPPSTFWTTTLPHPIRKPLNPKPLPFILNPAYPPNHQPITYLPRYKPHQVKPTNTISNRLFGLSPKLKDFGNSNSNFAQFDGLTTLKSVIKKDDAKRKNDKKVTFSAYNTVQVL